MGSPSSEPAQEAFWKVEANRVLGIVRRIGRAAANWLLRGVIEDASLIENYGSTRPTYCAVLLTIADLSKSCWISFWALEETRGCTATSL